MKPADRAPGGAGNGQGRGPASECPLCGKPQKHVFRPFCSRRCAEVDLGRWLNGSYAIPAEPEPDEGFDGGDGGEASENNSP